MHKDKKDSELIAEYYSIYEQKIFRLANAVLRDSWQAEEAVQETFLKIIRHRDTVRRMSEEKRTAYITRIAKSVAIDMYRANRNNAKKVSCFCYDENPDEAIENAVWNGSDSVTHGDMADEVGNRQLVKDILSRLDEGDSLILRLRIDRELSVRETAAVMNISEAAVRKRYERAVKRARKLLMKEMMLDGEQ